MRSVANKTKPKHSYYLGILVGCRPEMVVPPTWLLDFSLGMTCRYCRIKFLQTLHYHVILGIRWNLIKILSQKTLCLEINILGHNSQLPVNYNIVMAIQVYFPMWLRINLWWISNINVMATLFDTAELLLVQKTIKTGSSTWSLLNSMLD